MINIFKKCICRVECGEEGGTAFMLTGKSALTAFHVIKEHSTSEIKLYFDGEDHYKKAKYIEWPEKYKALDVALLELDEELHIENHLTLVDKKIFSREKWVSRGYPKSKLVTGENLQSDSNYVNQVLDNLQNGKVDIHLDFDRKLDSYAGLSGAPLIIGNKVAGILNIELLERGLTKELNALSIRRIKEELLKHGIRIEEEEEKNTFLGVDQSGTELRGETNPSDIRSISEKLKAACNSISKVRVSKFERDVASGKHELSRLPEREINAMKFRIFEACQEDLINFLESREREVLSYTDIEDLIERYTKTAEEIIYERSKDYKYPLKNRDTLKKIVLTLIEDCYLSFDNEGIYA